MAEARTDAGAGVSVASGGRRPMPTCPAEGRLRLLPSRGSGIDFQTRRFALIICNRG